MKRVYFLDLAKVMGAFLVVFAHLYSTDSIERLYIYSFHLPFFFIISGVFHNNKGFIQWRKYFKTLLVPTFFFIFFTCAIKPIIGFCLGANPISIEIKLLKMTLKILTDGRIGVYWFLIALFWCKVFTDVFIISSRKFILCISWGVLLAFPLVLEQYVKLPHRFLAPFLISQALMAMPFYLLGFFFKEKIKKLKPKWSYLILFVVSLSINIIITGYNGRVEMLFIQFGSFSVPINICFFYLNGVIGSLMLLSLALLPIKQIRLFTLVGESLLAIVGMQGLFTYIYRETVGWNQNICVSSLATVIIMIICCLLHRVLSPLYMSSIKK